LDEVRGRRIAANVLPVVRQIQAAGVTGLKRTADALNDAVCAPRAAMRGTARCAVRDYALAETRHEEVIANGDHR
jgi:hypothetical protein